MLGKVLLVRSSTRSALSKNRMHQIYKHTSKSSKESNKINCKWNCLREFGFTMKIIKFEIKLKGLGFKICYFSASKKIILVIKNSLWHSVWKGLLCCSPPQTGSWVVNSTQVSIWGSWGTLSSLLSSAHLNSSLLLRPPSWHGICPPIYPYPSGLTPPGYSSTSWGPPCLRSPLLSLFIL